MNPDDRKLLNETLALAQENHALLKKYIVAFYGTGYSVFFTFLSLSVFPSEHFISFSPM